jgi:rhodanese-related sulfurtransferase
MKITRRIAIVAFPVILLSGILAGCSQVKTTASSTVPVVTSQTTDVPTITVSDANTSIQKNSGNANFVLLDVRTADEFNSGHLAGAINLDYYAADFKANIAKLDKNKQYLVYCRTGIRGAASVQIMLDLGFTKAQNMAGGITEWTQEGYAVVK